MSVQQIAAAAADPLFEGPRITRFRYEWLGPVIDDFGEVVREAVLGEIEGVESCDLEWKLTSAVKGGGTLTLRSFDESAAVDWLNHRIKPYIVLEDDAGQVLEYPLGVFVPTTPAEKWTSTGRVWDVELLDKNTLLNQDIATDANGNPVSYSLGVGTNVVQAVADLIAMVNEGSSVLIEPSDKVLSQEMVWDIGTPLLQIINNILSAADYDSLWCDHQGRYRTAPYVEPQARAVAYSERTPFEPGDGCVRTAEWTLDRDIYEVPNRMVAVSTATEEQEALIAVVVDQNPDSPFSYQSRGRWISVVDTDVDVVDMTALQAYAKRRMTMLTSTAASASISHLWLPDVVIGAVVRLVDPRAGIDSVFEVRETKMSLDPLALVTSVIEEVVQ